MRPLLLAATLLAGAGMADAQSVPQRCGSAPWPHWVRYVERFISPDGRVIDRTAGDRTTSEGQAYALLFSLVANDRALFDRILRWSEANLAHGDLGRHLPAWNWGKRSDGRWGVLDANPASDADLWMAYALLEAGRLWSEPRFQELARRILANVVATEVADVPGLGPMLLPGPSGFALEGGRGFRLNPSYEPPQVLRRLASLGTPGPWSGILDSSVRMVRETAPRGAVPDWVLYRARRGFSPDPVHGRTGSYDAIRVYLWLGMLPEGDPVRQQLEGAVSGLLDAFADSGKLPERVDAGSLKGRGHAPVGFYAALLPLARGRAAQELERRVASAEKGGLFGEPAAYYDQNLVLFGRGFTEGRYRFEGDGGLAPAWEKECLGRAR